MKRSLTILVSTALLGAPAFAAAANDPWDAPLTFQIGAFRAAAETSIRLDSDSGRPGTTLDFENELGLEDGKTLPTLDFVWRWNPRHAIEASYVQLKRTGSRAATRQIDWGDITIPVNAIVDSRFETSTIRAAYRYSPINDAGNELALLLGLHYTTMKASLGATIAGGGGGASGSVSDEGSVDYPLPTLGIRGSARFMDNWRVTGFGQLLKVKIDEYDGELINFGAGVEWAFMPQAYAGLGYHYFKYDLTSEKGGARGQFNYTFDGPSLYLGWAFK